MSDPVPLAFPITTPEGQGRRWLPYVAPPLGEWIFSEAVGMGMDGSRQWTLRCHPVFEATIRFEREGKRFRLTINQTDFGRFRNLDVAKQRAEAEIVGRVRQIMPVLAIIRRRLKSAPIAREPEEPPRPTVKIKPRRDPNVLACACGATSSATVTLWAVPDRAGRSRYYCYNCLHPDVREIVDRTIAGQGCTSATPAKCECLRDAITVKDGVAYSAECAPRATTPARDG